MGWKAKAVQRSKSKPRCYSLLCISRWSSVTPGKQGFNAHIVVAPKDRYHEWVSSHFLLSLSFISELTLYDMEYRLGQQAQLCLLPISCPTPLCILGVGKCWKSTALVLGSAVAKTLVCYQYPTTALQNTVLELILLGGELTPAQPNPIKSRNAYGEIKGMLISVSASLSQNKLHCYQVTSAFLAVQILISLQHFPLLESCFWLCTCLDVN